MKNIEEILKKQKEYFQSGQTLPVDFRIKMLKKLYNEIKRYESDICEALKSDLGKSDYESYMCEIGMTLSEISYMIKHIKRFVSERRVRTPLAQFYAVSYEKSSPYGNVLIMSPWNYPFLLSISPLANAIAAGNTAVLKPSAYSKASSAIIKRILSECYEDYYIAVIEGGRKENACLLNMKFDFIFFTGSQTVGKEVLRNAAEPLTPVVLELGGKSPCIVDETADLKIAAKRIVFGKYLNCGQTCVAPDYILCKKEIKNELIREICIQIKNQYGEKPLENPDYGKIINEKHFERLLQLIDDGKVVIGGGFNEHSIQIEPTVLDNVAWDDAVMQEEIFGPVMPVLTYDNFDEMILKLKNMSKPLALYLFSENKKSISRVTTELSYGGGCINDTVIHLATSELGFGGVGESGMGAYHGKKGFEAFSHTKSIVNKKTWIDLPIRYSPYENSLLKKLIRIFLK